MARHLRWDLSSEDSRRHFMEVVSQMVLAGKHPVVEFVEPHRSEAQNSALHLWCEMVADTLNAAGCDMRATLKEGAEIPWTKNSVKEYLWRPVQIAMTGEESSTRPSKTQYPDISEALHRHIASRLGVTLPDWPSREAA